MGGDLLIDTARMIGNVAEELAQLVVDLHVATGLQRLERDQERKGRAIELDHLALEEVDALSRPYPAADCSGV